MLDSPVESTEEVLTNGPLREQDQQQATEASPDPGFVLRTRSHSKAGRTPF